MKNLMLIFIIFFFIISNNTVEYIKEGSDSNNISSFKLSNGSEFSAFESKGSWTDNFGNYEKLRAKVLLIKE